MAAAIIVPIKSFDLAKGRLADRLEPHHRAQIARLMAATVLAAGGDLPMWVVCDDATVATFAVEHGAEVIWRPSRGLNNAVMEGRSFVAERGFDHVVVAHADLPLARDLSWVADFDGVTIVPDRRSDGTNVMCLPANGEFQFQYGTGSARLHQIEAAHRDFPCRVVPDEHLGWDVDVPEDLAVVDLAALDPPPPDPARIEDRP